MIDSKNMVELANPSHLVENKTSFYQAIFHSKLLRVFNTMKTYLLDMAAKKKKMTAVKAKFNKLGDQKLITQIFAGWTKRCAHRMNIYKGVSAFQGSTKLLLEQGRFKALQVAFGDLRRWTRQEADLQEVTKRFWALHRRKRLTKSFGLLERHMRKCINQRRALNLLSYILMARACKADCFNLISQKAQRQFLYLEFASKLGEVCKQHSEQVVMDKIVGYNQGQLRKQDRANAKLKENKACKLRKIMAYWRGIVTRKNLIATKSNDLEKRVQAKVIERCLKLWTDRVFNDKFSLFCRFKTLEKCLVQVRAIRAIDHMNNVARKRKERKKKIVLWAAGIESLILSKIFHTFVRRSWETIEFKDNMEYSIERLQAIFKRLSLIELIDTLKRNKLNEEMAKHFLERHVKVLFKKSFIFWKKSAKLNQVLYPQMVEKSGVALKKFILSSMYSLTFENHNSLHNASKRLEEQMTVWRTRRAIKTLISGHSYRASLKSAKMLACNRLINLAVFKLYQKSQLVVKRLAFHGLAQKRMHMINDFLLRKAYGVALEAIQAEAISVKKKLNRVQRFRQATNFKSVRLVFGELKKHWRHVRNLSQLGGVFYKLHEQMAAKRIISIWTKFTFMSEHSLFQKTIKAKDFERLKLKKQVFKALRQPAFDTKQKVSKVESQVKAVRVKLLRSAFRSLASNAIAKTHGKRLELLNKAMKAWRKEVERAIEEREVDVMVKKEDLEKESVQQEKLQIKKDKNERFLRLLMGKDAPTGLALQIGGRRADYDEARTDKNHTEFSSEDFAGEDIAIKSAY